MIETESYEIFILSVGAQTKIYNWIEMLNGIEQFVDK